MKEFFLVFLGGGLGSGLRFLISKFLNPAIPQFYPGTLSVNFLGSLLIGLLMGLAYEKDYLSTSQFLLLATGFCGGFTTFSTFSLEQVQLFRDGAWTPLIVYTLGSLILGFLAVLLGFFLSRQF